MAYVATAAGDASMILRTLRQEFELEPDEPGGDHTAPPAAG